MSLPCAIVSASAAAELPGLARINAADMARTGQRMKADQLMEATPLYSPLRDWRQNNAGYPEKAFKSTAISIEILSRSRTSQQFHRPRGSHASARPNAYTAQISTRSVGRALQEQSPGLLEERVLRLRRRIGRAAEHGVD